MRVVTLNFEFNVPYSIAQSNYIHSASEQLAVNMDPYILALMQDGLEEILAQDSTNVDGDVLMKDSSNNGLSQADGMNGK